MWRWLFTPTLITLKLKRKVKNGDPNETEKLILAKALIEQVFGEEEVKIISEFKGKALKGRKYQPLYTFLPPDKPAHRVVLADFVTIEEGTGLVHQAPAFGRG